MTNVKRGDLAQVVKAPIQYDWMVGRLVKIEAACCFAQVEPAWRFDKPLRHGAVAVGCALDRQLKRIDPLTDDDNREECAQRERPFIRIEPIEGAKEAA